MSTKTCLEFYICMGKWKIKSTEHSVSVFCTKPRSKASLRLTPPHPCCFPLEVEKQDQKKSKVKLTNAMSFLTGSPKSSWQPIMTADTTRTSYWVNWKVLVCAIWILITALSSIFLIWKYETLRNSRRRSGNRETHQQQQQQQQEETLGVLYEDETWRPCLKGVHPVWLLVFRVFAFIVLLVLLIITAVTDGGSIFYFYTQWTFTSITIYFGLGSLISMHGC
ncbi:hypothetical protein K1719_047528, partial [Acacia pycnantha]